MIEIPVFECGAFTLWISPLLFHTQALPISFLPPLPEYISPNILKPFTRLSHLSICLCFSTS